MILQATLHARWFSRALQAIVTYFKQSFPWKWSQRRVIFLIAWVYVLNTTVFHLRASVRNVHVLAVNTKRDVEVCEKRGDKNERERRGRRRTTRRVWPQLSGACTCTDNTVSTLMSLPWGATGLDGCGRRLIGLLLQDPWETVVRMLECLSSWGLQRLAVLQQSLGFYCCVRDI